MEAYDHHEALGQQQTRHDILTPRGGRRLELGEGAALALEHFSRQRPSHRRVFGDY